MTSEQPPPAQVEDDEDEEFEPLFDYSKTTVSRPIFLDDDSDGEDVIITSAPKRTPGNLLAKITNEAPTSTPQKAPVKEVINIDDDDWLTTPPKLPKLAVPVASTGDRAVQQLRIKRAELIHLETQSSPGAIRKVEEIARMQVQRRREADVLMVANTPQSLSSHTSTPESAPARREKVILKIQNKSGAVHCIRIYSTDKFEKLFSTYAQMVGASLPGLSFRFDGDQLSPNSTPKELDMENDDIIEVYDKSPNNR